MDETVANKIEINPIGIFHSNQIEPYEAGRQPDEHHSKGCVELFAGHNFEQALIGLEGCRRVWILFQFHHNSQWSPMVLPPRGRDSKVGVFSTRSPYRPNAIGMSCVEIIKIDKLKIYVHGADLLNGSPILDIKPYVAYADSFPDIEPEWLKDVQAFHIAMTATAENQLSWLEAQGVSQLRGFLLHQLQYEPTNSKKKRVKAFNQGFVLAYKTWRAYFEVHESQLQIQEIYSGYSVKDLESDEDPYLDKELHRHFKSSFKKA